MGECQTQIVWWKGQGKRNANLRHIECYCGKVASGGIACSSHLKKVETEPESAIHVQKKNQKDTTRKR